MTDKIPGPPPMPVFGWRGNLTRFMNDPIAYMEMLRRDYGDIACLIKQEGSKGMIFAFGPAYNQKILTDAALFLNAGITHRGPEGTSNNRLGNGMLASNGAEHKRYRFLASPIFHMENMASYEKILLGILSGMLERWSGRPQINVWHEMNLLMKLFMGKIIFGLEDEKIILEITRDIDEWHSANISPASRLFAVDFPGTPYYRMMRIAEKLEAKIRALIDEKRAAASATARDFLSVLIRARDEEGKPLSDDELVGQITFMFAASYETTANSMAWGLFALSQYPDVMAELMDEIGPLSKGELSFEKVGPLPCLNGAVREVLRLFSPPVYSYRITSAATELGGHALPRGTTVAFSHYITHRTASVYADPYKFMPSRWKTIKPGPFEYLPFGAGAHACLGAQLALMTMKLVFTASLNRFRLTPVPGRKIERKVLVTLSPKNGIVMDLRSQDFAFQKSVVPVRGNVREMVHFDA